MLAEIVIQEVESGDIVRLPMAPDKITVKDATRFLSYDIMTTGEYKIPLGEELTRYSWSGMLPGMSRATARYVNPLAWLPPVYFESKFAAWKSKGTKLKLVVVGVPILQTVYLEDYTLDYSGGMGDVEYSVSFCIAKEIVVGTEDNTADQTEAAAGAPVTTTAPTVTENAKTYTVKSGDSLWKIAQNVLGDGSRWREIYDMNKGVIGSNPDLIYAGQVYNLPA